MIYHYYLSANSAQGHVDWTASRAKQLASVTRTWGYPASFYQKLVGIAMENARERGCRLDIVHRALDGAVSGIILPEQGRAVLNTPLWSDRSRHVEGLCVNETREDVQMLLSEVYADYASAKNIHDAWEQIYMRETNYEALDALAQELSQSLLKDTVKREAGVRTDAFFGAATPDGPVDYIANLTADCKKRYFLKGRAGTGKSTFLKKIAQAATCVGQDVEAYHCSFDTNSLDMLVLRGIDTCIFDSTAPHEYFPTRAGDEILDLYAASVCPGTDERNVAQISMLAKQYQQLTGRARQRMAEICAQTRAWEQEIEARLDEYRTALALETLTNALFR